MDWFSIWSGELGRKRNEHVLRMLIWSLAKSDDSGQFRTSRRVGSAELEIDASKWYRAAKKLESLGLWEIKSEGGSMVVKVNGIEPPKTVEESSQKFVTKIEPPAARNNRHTPSETNRLEKIEPRSNRDRTAIEPRSNQKQRDEDEVNEDVNPAPPGCLFDKGPSLSDPPYQDIIDEWNRVRGQTVSVTKDRKGKIDSRWKAQFFREN